MKYLLLSLSLLSCKLGAIKEYVVYVNGMTYNCKSRSTGDTFKNCKTSDRKNIVYVNIANSKNAHYILVPSEGE